MTTIKISKTTTEEQFIEVNLPVFRKGSMNSLFYKVSSPTQCVQVWTMPGGESIQSANVSLAYSGSIELQECSEEDYNLAFGLAVIRLQAL